MLGVDWVVLDRGVEPDAVALLLALVEGRLERALSAPAASSAAAAAPSPAAAGAFLGVLIALALVGRTLFLLGLRLAELPLDLGLDLVAKVELGRRLLALLGQPVPLAEVS